MIENLEALTEADFCGTELYNELFAIENKIERSDKKFDVLNAAKKCGMKKIAEEKIKVREQETAKQEREAARLKPRSLVEQITNFLPDNTGRSYPQMYCGSWIATEDEGIWSQESSQMKDCVCQHPILPVQRLRNMETGEEQITIAYKRDKSWKEITVPKVEIATARSITELARYGIAVTSENARLLVRYLNDLEMWNADIISVRNSTGKLGWHGEYFAPYDAEIKFDGEAQFRDLYRSISESGNYHVWATLMRELRASRSIEPRVALAASFASVLVGPLGSLPFIVDFNGQTEGGKTVTINVAASVWGDPAPGRYVGNFRATDTALETRADMLNNLPMILDDSKNASSYVIQNYESLIYNLCAGKGKARSNKKLGAAKENTWRNVIICNGESPISEHISSGGAVNRILEVSCAERIYEDPVRVSNIIAKNYGHAGLMFVECLKKHSRSDLQARLAEIEKKFDQTKFAQKQIMAAAVVILADELATKYLFEDGKALAVRDMEQIVASKDTIFEGQRCYEFLMEALTVYHRHFDPTKGDMVDQWGVSKVEEKNGSVYAYFFPTPFEKLLKDNGFSRKAFASYAIERGLMKIGRENGKDRDTVLIRLPGYSGVKRCIAVRITEPEILEEKFVQLSIDEAEDIPFE